MGLGSVVWPFVVWEAHEKMASGFDLHAVMPMGA